MIVNIATKFLEKNYDVIFDFGLWRESERDKYCEFARSLQANCVLYSIQASMETIRTRVNERTKEMSPNAFWIDQNAIEIFKGRFEELRDAEEYILITTD